MVGSEKCRRGFRKNQGQVKLNMTSNQSGKMRQLEAEEKAIEIAHKGLELYFAGKKEESISYFRKAVELRGDAIDLHYLGANLTDLGRCEEALPFLRKAVELGGNAVDYHWLGSTNCRLGRYEEASVFLEKAAKMGADSSVREANNYWLGMALSRLGRYEEALPLLKEAVKSADGSVDPQWLLDCLQEFQSCLDRVKEKTEKQHKADTSAPKACWLKRLVCGDENKHWERAQQTDTVRGYIDFLSQYPEGIHAAIAKSNVTTLQVEQQKLMSAILKITSPHVQCDVCLAPTTRGYVLNISAHLLKDYSPSSSDPTVKGAYGSNEAIYSFVKRRIAEIYRVVFTSAQMLRLKEVVVDCCHGARHFTHSVKIDSATTIYSASIIGEKATRFDWENISNEHIQKAWSVRRDTIPFLEFRYD